MRGEPLLPRLTEPPAGFDAPGPTHANNRTCQPNCDPFWTVPDRLADVYAQTSLDDHLGTGPDQPWLLNFDVYVQQQRWLVRYWDSYRLFGVAAHVRTDREVTDHLPLVRGAVESLAPGDWLWTPAGPEQLVRVDQCRHDLVALRQQIESAVAAMGGEVRVGGSPTGRRRNWSPAVRVSRRAGHVR